MEIHLFISLLVVVILLVICILRHRYPNQVHQAKECTFHSTNDYAVLKILEDNWQVIASEIPEFDITCPYPDRRNQSWISSNDAKFKDYIDGFKSKWYQGWQGESIWYNFPLMYNNNVIDVADKVCPKTIELLRSVDCKQIVGFSLLLPNSKLAKHKDPTGKMFDSMAGNMLLSKNDASVYVENDKIMHEYKHMQGKMVIFDSTNLHYADNKDKDEIRVILYIDFSTK